ncbi:hypothetical protein PIB30_048940 [Stylosanthes scabra]|uniref:FAR1 domain-containing protein n=1 Tax=Stylosanthes scabra TaxID=79078 RepID=A0ABU6ZFX5_9FABA|nr:hypothetical protein [Stylosanthes scabra]
MLATKPLVLPDGSLDVGIHDVDVAEVDGIGDGETQDADGSETVEQVHRLDVCPTFVEVMAMEFKSSEDAIRFYKQYSRGKGFSMRHGRKLRNKNGDVI